jgi:arabinose-5-phosphate isomerase
MTAALKRIATPLQPFRMAQQIILAESNALSRLANHLPADFARAIEIINDCKGCVIVSGIGKAGWIGQKVSASLASTGTRSHFVHPTEAMHGDLGRIAPNDVVLVFSNSGETAEIIQILPTLSAFDIPLIAVTANTESALAKQAAAVLDYGKYHEACSLGLAPSTTTTVMLALGDALALVASETKGFQATDFAKFHPGGSLGRKLSMVQEVMRPIEKCRVAREDETIRNLYVRLCGPSRRSGAVLITDDTGRLTGLFTDSDLARMLERQLDALFDAPVRDVMTKNPITVTMGTKTLVAVEILASRNISELPIVDQTNLPMGLIDITDVVGLLPR